MSSPPVPSATPHVGCHATKEELRADGKKSSDFCGSCELFGIHCPVSFHPSAPPLGTNFIC